MKYGLSRHSSLLVCLIAGALLLASCSTKVNTAGSRFWQSFTTRFNIYYNGNKAFKEGQQAQEKGTKDNFTERIPVFAVADEKNAGIGKSNYEACIEKMQKAVTLRSIKKKPKFKGGKSLSPKQKLYMQRKEYNPFLKRCWLLMGISQFNMGEFEQAGATFNYICRLYAAEPEVVAEARTWMARCYAQSGWLYDAEDVLSRQSRDSIPPRLLRERDATMADLLIRQQKFEEAMPYLESAIKRCKRSAQKARLYLLQGQILRSLGRNEEAYKSFGKCISQSPAYEVQFNARIMQTEVVGTKKSTAAAMIKRLKRMARKETNKEYLDQVYYAMGNIYMAQTDTAKAIGAYETGREKSTRSGVEKGVLLLRLGEVYWAQHRFDKAQPCFSECISMLSKDHARYQEVMKRSKVLDELVPFTSAVHLQDSLQTLAKLPAAERNAAIDRVIEALKKKEAEERKAKRDSAANARAEANGGGNTMQRPGMNTPQMPVTERGWYFYNTQLVNRGKQDFRQKWGNRKNEDDWRRLNHTVVATNDSDNDDLPAVNGGDNGGATATGSDSALPTDSTSTQGGNAATSEADSLALDPHNREYYMAQIPFTEEQIAASNDIIMDGLYNAGVIEKDKLEDFPLAASTLERLVNQYPDCTQLEDALYHLFLLYSRWEKPEEANRYRQMLAAKYPASPMTRMITDPDFELLARYGLQIEDSLYTETYQAYRDRKLQIVNRNYATSTRRFPNGLNRPKFIFIHSLGNLGTLPTDTIISELRGLLKEYPKADVAEMAGMIVKGLESGRTIGDGTYDLGSLWSKRTAEAEAGGADAQAKELTPDRHVPFIMLLAYPTDSINDDRLLYEVAHFNFTSFMVRGFDLSFEKTKRLTQFRIGGFNSYDEAHAYTQKIYSEPVLHDMLRRGRIFLVSEQNLPLLGMAVTYDEYQAYFDEHYSPLKLPENIRTLLEEPNVDTIYEDESNANVNVNAADDDGYSADEEAIPVVEEEVPATEEDAPVIEEVTPVVEEEAPVVEEEAPAVPAEQTPTTEEEVPTTKEETPTTEEETPTTKEEPASEEEDTYPAEDSNEPATEGEVIEEEDEGGGSSTEEYPAE